MATAVDRPPSAAIDYTFWLNLVAFPVAAGLVFLDRRKKPAPEEASP